MREDFPSIEHFYEVNPERKRSLEVDYGVMWTDGGLNWPHYRVSWVEATGEFYALRLAAGRGGAVEVLGFAEDRAAAEAALEGWAELDGMRLSWVRSRLHLTPSDLARSSIGRTTIRSFKRGDRCLVNGFLVEIERHARRSTFVRVLDERLPGNCRIQLDKATFALSSEPVVAGSEV